MMIRGMNTIDMMCREKQCTITTGLDMIANVRNEHDGGHKHMSGKQGEEFVQPGRFGVTNKQMIPAIKKAIAEGNIEQLMLLEKHYLYTFEKSLRYLNKAEKKYITEQLS